MITKIRVLKMCAVTDFGKKIAQHIEYDFCGMKNKSIMAAQFYTYLFNGWKQVTESRSWKPCLHKLAKIPIHMQAATLL